MRGSKRDHTSDRCITGGSSHVPLPRLRLSLFYLNLLVFGIPLCRGVSSETTAMDEDDDRWVPPIVNCSSTLHRQQDEECDVDMATNPTAWSR